MKSKSGIRFKISQLFDRILHGSKSYYTCILFAKDGTLVGTLLRLFYSGVRLDKIHQVTLKDIPQDAVVVYANKYRSLFEYLFYFTRYRNLGLKVPEIHLARTLLLWQPLSQLMRIILARLACWIQRQPFPDPYASGYLRDQLLSGRAAFLSLVGRKNFYFWFIKQRIDPLQYLIELQQSTTRPIFIFPQLMFFSKKPRRSIPSLIDILFGTEERPGRTRKLVTLFKNPGKVFAEVSEPVNLQEYLGLPQNRELNLEQLSLKLRRYLVQRINRHRQSITGPILKSLEELKQSILTSERLQAFMHNYSESRKISIQKVHREADGYLDEIAAKYSMGTIRILERIVHRILNTMFEGVIINQEMLSTIKRISQKGPLVLIPCHKSHIDYLILSYLLFQNDMPVPYIAAGKNLAFWPLGPIFRRCGAFFIRRTFKGAVLYARVFAEYVQKLLEEGFNVEFFIEGGRSRTGKLIMPKLGLLTILLNAYKQKACEDLNFVPIFIGYDRVLEESAYLHEIEGGKKEPESFLQVLQARKFLKKRYGKIYIKVHQPLSLNELLARQNLSLAEMTSKQQNALNRNLGHRIINAINDVTVVTPHALVASVILNGSPKGFTYQELMHDLETLTNHLSALQASLSDTLIVDPVSAVENVLKDYVQSKFIEQVARKKEAISSETLFRINENRRTALEYYKNNCIAFFIPAAFTALAILEKDAFQFSASDLHGSYRFLQEFFKNEFAYDVDKTSELYVRKTIKAFIDDAILMPHPTMPDTYNLTSAGYRKLKLFASFLKSYFEAYWIVLRFFKRYPRAAISAKDRLKKIQARANRMYKFKRIDRKEAISKIIFGNAVDFYLYHGVKGAEDTDNIEHYAEAIQKYLRLLPP